MTKGKESGESPLGRLSRRTRTLVFSALAVVALGLLIYGVSAVSAPKDQSAFSKMTPAEQSDAYYDRAVVQQAQGNLPEATNLAQQALEANPANSQAKKLLVTLEAAQKRTVSSSSGPATGGGSSGNSSGTGGSSGKTPGANPGETTATPAPEVELDAAFFTDPKDIKAFLPAKIEGWVLTGAVAVGPDGTVAGDPAAGNAALKDVSRGLLAVHDRKSVDAARTFVDKTIKRAYAEDGAAVVVDGQPGYFGTDGARFAAVGFTRGRYAYEVVVTVTTGDPAAYKDAALALAMAFPAKI